MTRALKTIVVLAIASWILAGVYFYACIISDLIK